MIKIKSKNKKKKGFTLIELIVVIAILGILAAIIVPLVMGYNDTARRNTAASNAKVILNAVKAHDADAQSSTPDSTTMATLKTNGIISKTATGAQVETLPSDIEDTATIADLEAFVANPKASTNWDTTNQIK